MPRKGNVPKRDVLPDPMYGSKVVSKLINNLMIDGKKGKAQTIVYDAFAMVAEKTGEDALEVFNKAMDNIMPVLEGKARRNLFEKYPPKYIYVFRNRMATWNNGNEVDPNTGKRWATTMCHAWFIWEKGSKTEPIIRWL